MLAPYVKVRVSTDGEARLISFEIPGVELQLLESKGKPLQAFGEQADHDIGNLVQATKYKIDLEMSRLVGVRYMKGRIEALQEVKRYIDRLLSTDKVESIKRRDSTGRYNSWRVH